MSSHLLAVLSWENNLIFLNFTFFPNGNDAFQMMKNVPLLSVPLRKYSYFICKMPSNTRSMVISEMIKILNCKINKIS